jgi:hypothetical protein
MGGTAASVHRSSPANLDMWSSYVCSAGIHRVFTNDSSLVLRAAAVGERECRDISYIIRKNNIVYVPARLINSRCW